MGWLARTFMLVFLVGLVRCEKNSEEPDASAMFMDTVKHFFNDKNNAGGIQNMANAFVQSDAGKQMGEIISGNKPGDGLAQIVSGFSTIMSAVQGQGRQGLDLSMIGSFLEGLTSSDEEEDANDRRVTRDIKPKESEGFDFATLLNIGSMFLGQQGGNTNSDVLMGVIPMILEQLGGGGGEGGRKHDHSGHAWFMPPILENLHIMWDHFSNSELGQALWKNSGLKQIIIQMSDADGRIQYEKILDSFENPIIRRRWIKSLTNFVAEWISHISDPMIQQRYLTTAQFICNSFLKSQGFPKTAMFDSNRPVESISRLSNALVKRHLGMKIDSQQYVRPAISYVQELVALASEKGFIMSRVNARELSNRLNDAINNDIIGPMLKAYRAYKWAVKTPHCASQILCTINEKRKDEEPVPPLRSGLAKVASFPAAWAVSQKTGANFWSLYGALTEDGHCIEKFPADCTAYHEEEIRVTTESIHNDEL